MEELKDGDASSSGELLSNRVDTFPSLYSPPASPNLASGSASNGRTPSGLISAPPPIIPAAKDLAVEIQALVNDSRASGTSLEITATADSPLRRTNLSEVCALLYASTTGCSFSFSRTSSQSLLPVTLRCSRRRAPFVGTQRTKCSVKYMINKVGNEWELYGDGSEHTHELSGVQFQSTSAPVSRLAAVNFVPHSAVPAQPRKRVRSAASIQSGLIHPLLGELEESIHALMKDNIVELPTLANQIGAATHTEFRTILLAAALQRRFKVYLRPRSFMKPGEFSMACCFNHSRRGSIKCNYYVEIGRVAVGKEYEWRIVGGEQEHQNHVIQPPTIGTVGMRVKLDDLLSGNNLMSSLPRRNRTKRVTPGTDSDTESSDEGEEEQSASESNGSDDEDYVVGEEGRERHEGHTSKRRSLSYSSPRPIASMSRPGPSTSRPILYPPSYSLLPQNLGQYPAAAFLSSSTPVLSSSILSAPVAAPVSTSLAPAIDATPRILDSLRSFLHALAPSLESYAEIFPAFGINSLASLSNLLLMDLNRVDLSALESKVNGDGLMKKFHYLLFIRRIQAVQQEMKDTTL